MFFFFFGRCARTTVGIALNAIEFTFTFFLTRFYRCSLFTTRFPCRVRLFLVFSTAGGRFQLYFCRVRSTYSTRPTASVCTLSTIGVHARFIVFTVSVCLRLFRRASFASSVRSPKCYSSTPFGKFYRGQFQFAVSAVSIAYVYYNVHLLLPIFVLSDI